MAPTGPQGSQLARAPTARFKSTIIPKASSRAAATTRPETVEPPSALVAQIDSAKRLSDLPSFLCNSRQLKQFRATCYHGWMTSSDLFDAFSLESDHFLNIIRDAFCKVFPTVSYVPRQKDVFHRTVSTVA